jgi:hypothetical protein
MNPTLNTFRIYMKETKIKPTPKCLVSFQFYWFVVFFLVSFQFYWFVVVFFLRFETLVLMQSALLLLYNFFAY